MEEHEKKADELEQQADKLEERRDELDDQVGELRSDFEQKLGDSKAPGLLDEEEAAPGGLGEAEEEDDSDSE
jgi:hypothetical protein